MDGIVSAEKLESLRQPLIRHCYRMLGSAADAEDAVQDTLIRAHERRDQYDPSRGALRTWLYRIATRICLDRLRGADRRMLFGGPEHMDGDDLGVPLPPHRWVEPVPGARLFGTDDPADTAVERETVRLAFVALLQHLPAKQRAVLVLRDVLAYSAAECADILDTSVASVTSALQRARARLADAREIEDAVALSAPQVELLERYVDAFESHDVAGLTNLLCADARTSMPPFDWWIRGGSAIATLMGATDDCARDRFIVVDVNGAPGLGQYRPDEHDVLRPFALIAVEARDGQIARTTTFLGMGDRFADFGLPDVFPHSSAVR
ncbi:RNA polymerase subunit sigma-70 [Paramicrobacterium agarici]|uniref:RNA polymerase ECF family sigma subunit n=1 Tax=Paramicrobacterium agarici TaxID=630514 RepID=A0A2A9E016_9MICO|nr:RNA polymerase subunit sigma-70 [Microbacterium agarici]PFG31725.1 RNA polymerase ECF family sigma subunit [Microbacterium agarici]